MLPATLSESGSEQRFRKVVTSQRWLQFSRRQHTPSSYSPPSQLKAIGEKDKQHSDAPLVAKPVEENADENVSCNDPNKHELVHSCSKETAGDVEERTDANVVTQAKFERRDPKDPLSLPTANAEEEKPKVIRRVLTKLNRARRTETHPPLGRGPEINQPTPVGSPTQLVEARIGRSKTFSPFKRKDSQINQWTTTASQVHGDRVQLGRSKTHYFFQGKNRQRPVPIASQTQLAIGIPVSNQPPNVGALQSEEQDIHGAAVHPEGDKLEPVATKCAEQTEAEAEEIKKLRQDLSESRSQVAELQRRFEEHSRDLENSNSFLNTTDKSSDSDIINALRKLNAEVQQSTTYMADCLAEGFEFKNLMTDAPEEQISAVRRASETIGRVLAESLGTKPPEYIPMLLPIAFQAHLTSALAQAASSWVFEPGHNKFISAIYQSLRGAEAQAVSGRWRVLARFHIIHAWANHPDDLVKAIIGGFSDILLAAGCTAPRSDITAKITSKFEQKLALLVELAVRLNKLFDEVVSSDFEVLVVRPGEKFESKNMDDTDSDRIGVKDASVLCATHLGLMKRTPMGTLWERGKKQKLMVLKAKVLLESFLDLDDE